MALKQHDLRAWVVVLGGFLIDQLNSIKVEFPDKFSKQVGGQGEVTRSKNNDPTCRITITVPETSQANTILDQLFAADDNTLGGVTYNVLVKNIISGTAVEAPNAWLMKKANIEEKAESGEREWVIETGASESLITGS